MNEAKLNELKTRLEAEHDRISNLLVRTHAHFHRKEPLSADFADQANQTSNDDVVQALDHEGHVELADIKAALKRIKKGEYGICQTCDEEINENRLDAIPETAFCIKCTPD